MTLLVRRPVPTLADGAWPDHVPPLLRRIYAARGAHDADQARPKLAHLPSPGLMGGMALGGALLSALTTVAQRGILGKA